MSDRLPAVERRQRLLEAAQRLFAENGVAGMTTAAVAKRCGVTEPILYRHFPSKKALLHQLMEDVIHRVGTELGTLAKNESDPVMALRSIISHYPALSRAHEVEFAIINRALAEVQDASTRDLLKIHYEGYLTILEGIIATGQKSGKLRRDISPQVGAWHLIHSALGYLFTRPLHARGQDDRRYDAGLTEVTLAGLLA